MKRARASRRRVLTVVGARPQFVKAAPLARALRERFDHLLLHTGQHFDDAMSGVFFRDLGLPQPDYHLGISGGTHAEMTGRMLVAIETVLQSERPDLVVVLGDTNSTLAGALAAAKLDIPVGHVEAGLRSFDRRMPEEVNRVATDHLASLLFCPTAAAAKNLAREGITRGVIRTGDVMRDVLRAEVAAARRAARALDLPAGFYFATVHRQENTDDDGRLRSILRAFESLPRPVVFAAHPRTRHRMRALGLAPGPNVLVRDPFGYRETLGIVLRSTLVLTDSGGLQKEAFLLGVPCVTLRDSTEWVETLAGGANRLVGWSERGIVKAVSAVEAKRPLIRPGSVYGTGSAARRTVAAIARFLAGRGRRS